MKDNMKRAPFSTQIDLSKFDMKDFAKASDEEKRQQEVMGESTTFLKDGLRDSAKIRGYGFYYSFGFTYFGYSSGTKDCALRLCRYR